MRGLIVDYAGVLDGPAEDQERWRTLFAAVKEHDVQTAILSNDAGGPDAEPIREWEYNGIVDAVILSGEVGAEKPDPRAFRAAADAIDLPLSDCVLVDDNIHNVRACVELGMVGLLHTAFERTTVEVQSIFDITGEF